MPYRIPDRRAVWLALVFSLSAIPAAAQQTNSGNGRFPLYDQFVPPGVAGQMHLQAGTLRPAVPQQVRVTLPAAGTVTFFDGAVNRPLAAPAPAQAALFVGVMYRLKVSELERFPHTEFFPSIELISELHPPPGQAERFPIEIELLEEEFEQASRGRMVTKVVYLEQPDRVPLGNLSGAPRVTDVDVGQNAIAEADSLGRPIAIVRLGGRTPDPNDLGLDQQFWGPLPPVRLTARPAATRLTMRPQPPVEQGVFPPQIERPQFQVFPTAAPAPESALR